MLTNSTIAQYMIPNMHESKRLNRIKSNIIKEHKQINLWTVVVKSNHIYHPIEVEHKQIVVWIAVAKS